MGTVTITSATFNALPATAPANWPVGVTYPAGALPNGTHQATLSDAEMLQILTWVAATQIPSPSTPTVGQILLSFIGYMFTSARSAIQNWGTLPPTPPPPINLV